VAYLVEGMEDRTAERPARLVDNYTEITLQPYRAALGHARMATGHASVTNPMRRGVGAALPASQ
jgi:hypothetical protein